MGRSYTGNWVNLMLDSSLDEGDGDMVISSYGADAERESGVLERLAAMLNRVASNAGEASGQTARLELAGWGGAISCRFPIGSSRADRKRYCTEIGKVLGAFTMQDQEPMLLRDIFRLVYGYSDRVELDVLVADTICGLNASAALAGENGTETGRVNRLERLSAAYAEYLEEHDSLHLDGFLNFRLREYRRQLRLAAESTVKERLMQRQYREFVRLLSGMVERKEKRGQDVHLIHDGGLRFRLLDDKMRPLHPEADTTDETGAAPEDSMVVTRLLHASPDRLYIHTSEPESRVIRTIIGIFGERAALQPGRPAP